jgi:ribosomal protein S18 acetylase RimI-like enzyme
MPVDLAMLRHIDAYLDAAPRTAARAEEIASFTLFVNEGHGWRYYARPTPGATGFTEADVRAVRERQRELSQPESFEWITELTPEVGAATAADGMRIVHHPLMVRSGDPVSVPVPDGVEVAVVDADDDLASINAVADVAFAHPGTAAGAPGLAEATAAANGQSTDTIAFQRGRMLAGLTVAVTARVSGAIAAVGWHQPVNGSSEVVGVATLPAFRRRGLATAVAGTLVADAHERGVETVFLSADDDDVARVYERVGFLRIGAAGAASGPTG